MVRWGQLPADLPAEVRDFKRALRQAIQNHGFASLGKLAKATGIPDSTLSDAAGGRPRLPTRRNLDKILRACGMPPLGDTRYRSWGDLHECALRAARKLPDGRRHGRQTDRLNAAEPELARTAKLAEPGWPRRPRQLLVGSPCLVGRHAEIHQLDRYRQEREATGRSPLIVISGPTGVGKTALATDWAQTIGDRFPDGHLYVKLGHRDPQAPHEQGEALGQFLRSLGVPAERIPVNVAEQTTLYRSLTSGQKLLVMLDDVCSSDQVVPLLPAHPSLVIVTSRHRLDGLIGYGCHQLQLSPLSQSAGIELFEALLGPDRVQQELAEARELVELCDRLPLALYIVAPRIRRRPSGAFASQVAKLRNEQRRIFNLSTDDSLSLQASLDLSYGELNRKARRLYRALGLHPGPDIPAELAMSLAIGFEIAAERILERLVDASLLSEPAEGRYQFIDLIRLHARQRANQRGSKKSGREIECHIIEWYLSMARAADRMLTPYRTRLTYEFHTRQTVCPAFADRQQALHWLDVEHQNLLAITRLAGANGMAETTWHLCDALWSLFLYRRHYPDRLEIDQLGVTSARAWGNQFAEADMLKRLGRLHGLTGRFDRAVELLAEAIELYRGCGEVAGEADALADLGRVHLDRGATNEAREPLAQALRINRERGDERSVALSLINYGRMSLETGHHDSAIEDFEQAISILERYQQADPYNHARALIALGRALVRVGRHDRATTYLTSGLEIMSKYDSQYRLAEVSALLGEIAEQTGDLDRAIAQYQSARQTYLGLGADEARRLDLRIATLTEGRPT